MWCTLASYFRPLSQQSINQSVGLLEQLCSHDGQGGRHGAGVPRRDDLRRQGAEGGQRPGRAGGSGRGRPGLGQHAVLPALPGLGQEVGRVGAPRPRAGGHARQPRAAAQGQGGPGHGQEGEAPGQEEEDQLGRRGRAQRAQVAVQAPQAQRRERLRGVPRACRGRRRGRSQAGEHPDALLAQEAARGGLEECDAGAAQARAAAPQAQRGPDRQDVPRVQEEQSARRRGCRGEGVQEHRGHHAGRAVLLRPRAQLHPALPHGAQAVPGAPAEARGGRAALADLRRRTPHQALREITGAAGRFQHRPARAAPDPGATQRLPQVHPEELGGLVRHGVRGRVRQVRGAGHRRSRLNLISCSHRGTSFVPSRTHGFISISSRYSRYRTSSSSDMSVTHWTWKMLLYAATSWQAWVLAAGMLYAAFQLHLLPEGLARVVARVFFYPTWPLTYLSRRKNYWTLVDSHVLLGAAPMSFMPHVDALVSRGVRAVVNLCDEYAGPEKQYRRQHVQQLRLPTVDHCEPSLAALEAAVAFIRTQKQRGVRTYVHCKGGTGRSAAVALCWLVANRGMTPREAQDYLNEKRHVRKGLYLQPNVLAFCNKIQTPKASDKQERSKVSSEGDAVE